MGNFLASNWKMPQIHYTWRKHQYNRSFNGIASGIWEMEPKLGVATCTQQYCWNTQQTVNEPFCPSVKLVSGRLFFRKNSGRRHSDKLLEEPSSGRRRWASRRTPEYVLQGRVPEFFRKKGLLKVILCDFFKMQYFYNNLILINKLRYKINNIIIHKLLVNIIMTNICISFFTHM